MAAASAGALQSSAGTPLSVSGIQHPSQIQQQQNQSHNQNPQSQQHQRLPYLQRAGSGGQINILSGCGSGSNATTIVSSQHQRGPNVAPGWRRHTSNGDIIYIR